MRKIRRVVASYAVLVSTGSEVVVDESDFELELLEVREGVVVDVDTSTGLISRVQVVGLSNLPRFVSEFPAEEIVVCAWLLPGFIDIHTHGRGCASSGEVLHEWLDDPSPGLCQVAREGTTAILATVTFPAKKDDIGDVRGRTIESLGRWIGRTDHGGAVIAGIHVEGPIVQNLGGLVPPDASMTLSEFRAFLDLFEERMIRVMTISPSADLPEDGISFPRLKELRERGIVASLGHDRDVSEDVLIGALRLQTDEWRMHLTHLFNVQKLHHRVVGLANIGLINEFPNLPQYEGLRPPTVEVIGDLVHVHPAALEVVLRCRSPSNICLISDSILFRHPLCEGPTHFLYGGRPVRVHTPKTGRPRVVVSKEGADVLAGSCVTMLEMFHCLRVVFRRTVGFAAMLCSYTPAMVAGLLSRGRIARSMRADFALFSSDFSLQVTFVDGRIVHRFQ